MRVTRWSAPLARRRWRRSAVALTVLAALFASNRLAAQWLNYPSRGVPRAADGTVNMRAPAPRMANGKPDLSGLWMTAEPNRGPRATAD